MPKDTKTGIAVFYRFEHVLILIDGKIRIDIIGFVIDIINFINSGAGKCQVYLGFYHSHCSWFGRFELNSRDRYVQAILWFRSGSSAVQCIVVLCVSHHESSLGECFG